ncbi:MAG: GNAT family N-acetyltransferase [Actinomycetes bacterium]
MTVVRTAVPADRSAVVRTVVTAFAQDPAWDFITAGDREHVAPPFAEALFDSRVGSGTIWIADNGASAALWELRDGASAIHADSVWTNYRSQVGEQAWACLCAYEDALANSEPERPYWYLGVLATDPARHGQGLASEVLAPILAIADEAGLPCWLETSTLSNVRFYEHRGFIEMRECDIVDGPPTWWLGRPAVTTSTPS